MNTHCDANWKYVGKSAFYISSSQEVSDSSSSEMVEANDNYKTQNLKFKQAI